MSTVGAETTPAKEGDSLITLKSWCSQADCNELKMVDSIAKKLGRCEGIISAAEICPEIITTFCEVVGLAALEPKLNKDNYSQFQSLALDIIVLFNKAGYKAIPVSSELTQNLLKIIKEGMHLVEKQQQPGWLLDYVLNDKRKDQIEHMHSQILAILKGCNLGEMVDEMGMSSGDYMEHGRAVRRRMKQLGGGNPEQGIKLIHTDIELFNEMSTILQVEEQVLKEELQFVEQSEAASSSMVSKDTQPVYQWYTKDAKMDFSQMRKVISDLGMLEGLKPNEIEGFCCHKIDPFLQSCDQENLDCNSFSRFYASLTKSSIRELIRSQMGMQIEDDLHGVFLSYCGGGNHALRGMRTLDNPTFVRLCKQCNIVGRQQLQTTEIDIVFMKVKQKGQRRIDFEQFIEALNCVATRTNVNLQKVIEKVITADHKLTHNTGGSDGVLKERECATPLVKKQGRQLGARPQTAIGSRTYPKREATSVGETDENAAPQTIVDKTTREKLKHVFVRFSTFGKTHQAVTYMDNVRFSKLVRDTGLLDNKLSTTKADLIFAKLMNKTTKKMDFTSFITALNIISQEKKMDVHKIHEKVLKSQGPTFTNTTQASFVRLHDDKSSYTGVHAQGGPTTVDNKITLGSLVDRQTVEHKQKKTSTTPNEA